MSYQRHVSAMERLWLAAEGLAPPFANQLVLEGDGELDMGEWRAAVAEAAAANPGSRLVLRGHLSRARWVDGGASVAVTEVDGSRWDGNGPDGADFLRRALPPRSGPTCEVMLVRGTPPRVVVRTQHAAMDGGGHLHLTADIFRRLRGEAAVGAPSTLTDDRIASALHPARPARRRANQLSPTGASSAGRLGCTWRRRFVPGRHSRLLARVATALARSARSYADGEVRVDVSVDMRRHLDALGLDRAPATANLTGLVHLNLERGADVEAVHRRIRAALDAAREAEFVASVDFVRHVPLAVMRAVGRADARRAHRANQWMSTAVVSNLGRLPLDDFAYARFRTRTAYFIPPGTEHTALFLAMTGTDAGVELCATQPRRLADGGRLDRCLADLAAALLDR